MTKEIRMTNDECRMTSELVMGTPRFDRQVQFFFRRRRVCEGLALATVFSLWSAAALGQSPSEPDLRNPVVSGDLIVWHTITITFDGPQTAETAEPNPFTDYRLDVVFKRGDKSIVVPGYFAADGDAGQTGAARGEQVASQLRAGRGRHVDVRRSPSRRSGRGCVRSRRRSGSRERNNRGGRACGGRS